MTKIWVAANGGHKKSCGTAAGLRRRLVPLALCLAIGAPAMAAPDGTADIVFVRGNVIPMTAPDARAQALAVKDGKIEAIGTDAEIDGYKGKDTKVVDLAGRTLLPGFIDAHGHLTLLAQRSTMAELAPPPVGPVSDIAGLQAAMRNFAKAHPNGWLVGSGYDDARMTEGRHPTRQELDAVSADRPVVVVHVSSHLATLNTKALEMTGLLHAAEDPPGGVIRREADGRTASGVIEEGALFKALANLPRPSIDQQIAQLTAAQHVYARNGLTTAQDGAASADAWDLLKEAARRSALFLDVNALPLIAFPFPDLDKVPFNAPYDRHLRAAGVKIIVDGSPQGRTAWLSEPYHQAPAGLPADYAGYRQIPDDRLKALLRRAAGNGWRVFAHVNGDAAIQQLIDTVRAVDGEGGAKPKRT
ncbi:MAG: amidohydrolase, partial [Alphaproteobacteria bacterium HGW-Alphaproteobacteria-13]